MRINDRLAEKEMTARLSKHSISLQMRQKQKESGKLQSVRTAFGNWERWKAIKKKLRRFIRVSQLTPNNETRPKECWVLILTMLTQSKNGPRDLCPRVLPVRQLTRVDQAIWHDDA